MKKTLLLCLFPVLSAGLLFSLADGRIAFGGSLGTAAMIYGGESVAAQADDFPRFVLECDVSMGFLLDEAVRLNVGTVSACDFRIKNGDHCNLVDYAFYGGIRLYPGLAGLCLGVDYMLGRRTDFVDLSGNAGNGVSSTAWGNGFRFLAAYDFTSGGTGFAPVVGCAWRRMPRGGSSDNLISLFFRMSYR